MGQDCGGRTLADDDLVAQTVDQRSTDGDR
jgi:hypothetical protein